MSEGTDFQLKSIALQQRSQSLGAKKHFTASISGQRCQRGVSYLKLQHPIENGVLQQSRFLIIKTDSLNVPNKS